jgi:hypothetical protein
MDITVIRDRPRFYALLALALGGFVVIGFARTFYLRDLFGLAPLSGLMHLHGLVFTAWLGVFIVQTRLVAAGRVDLHRRLGLASIVLVVLVILVGVASSVDSGVRTPIRGNGLTGAQGTIVSLTSIALFTVFVAAGLWFRRRAALHKRLMVLAMIAVLTPATARLIAFAGLREHAMFVQIAVLSLFVAWCFVSDWRSTGRIHPVFVCGGPAIVVSWPLRLWAAKSEWWTAIGTWIVS